MERTPERDAQVYLKQLDRLLPGAVVGLHLVGSVALGGYRRRRSDLDFVGVLDNAVEGASVPRLRIGHAQCGAVSGSRALLERRSLLTGTIRSQILIEGVGAR